MERNQQKRPRGLAKRHVNESKEGDKAPPRKRQGWMRDKELDRSINAAVQDGDDSRER
jgi:hypothetical protein